MVRDQKTNILQSADANPEVLEFLATRRSTLAKLMDGETGSSEAGAAQTAQTGQGPNEAQIAKILEIAARVPDHRKIAPWRFVLFQGEARAKFGDHLADRFAQITPHAGVEHIEFERTRFLRAPLVITVISTPIDCPRGTPQWEQELSAGAVCMNILLAARALGFGGQWLSEWYAGDAVIDKALNVSSSERVAGFMYIGTTQNALSERPRPIMADLVTKWDG